MNDNNTNPWEFTPEQLENPWATRNPIAAIKRQQTAMQNAGRRDEKNKPSISIELIEWVRDATDYYLTFRIIAINLLYSQAKIRIVDRNLFIDNELVSKDIDNLPTVSKLGQLIVEVKIGKSLAEKSKNYFDGAADLVATINCRELYAETKIFYLSEDNTKFVKEVHPPKQASTKSNPFGNNLYIAFIPNGKRNIKTIAQTAQDILDNAKINVQVRYFDMSGTDSKVLDNIILRKYLSKTDGLVFVGHGNDINGYVTPRVSYTGQEENAEFFGLIGGHLEGGTTIQAALQSINNPNFKLDYE